MIYIYRTLWAIFYIPIFLMECVAFVIGCLSYPFIAFVYYVKHGSTIGLKWAVDTMAFWIEKKYQNLRTFIETLN